MAARVTKKVNYRVIYGYTQRVDGIVRADSRKFTRSVVPLARARITINSRARHRGRYPRTGRLRASVGDRHAWSNQYGCGRVVFAGEKYAKYVIRGTVGPIRARSRGAGGQFSGGFSRMPVGKSQGATGPLMREVAGQQANPFIPDAVRIVMRKMGY